MALVKCPNCGNNISEKATACPHCGEALSIDVPERKSIVRCEECGSEIPEGARICPNCGFPLSLELDVTSSDVSSVGTKRVKNKKIIGITVIAAGVLILVIGFFVIKGNILSANGKHAVQIVEQLQGMMKDPDSFKLREDVVVIVDKDATTYTFISYSANNSYGAALRGLAMYKDYTYVGDYNDDNEDDFDTEDEQKAFLIARGELAMWQLGGSKKWISSEAVSRKTIAKKLHIEYQK